MTEFPLGFELKELLACQANANLYRALDTEHQQTVLLVMPAHQPVSHGMREQLVRHTELVKQLPNHREGQGHYLFEDGHTCFIVEPDFGGMPLVDIIPAQGLPLERFFTFAEAIVVALSGVHSRRFILLNLSPSIILADSEGLRVELADMTQIQPFSQVMRDVHPQLDWYYAAPELFGRGLRVFDYRADYYSLGASFYHMLSGKPPFVGDDPLSIAHQHLAQQPVDLCQLRSDVPPLLAELVAKLMAKAPEQRYQGAVGLLSDLRKLQAFCSSPGRIEPFALGREDVPQILSPSPRLYGVDAELDQISQALHKADAGKRQCVLIHGGVGMGKASVMLESLALHPATGFALRCQYRLEAAGRPFSGIQQALQQLVNCLLALPEEDLNEWRQRLRMHLGSTIATLNEIIPQVISQLGLHITEVPCEVAVHQRLSVYTQALVDFILFFAGRNTPLYLFVDDAQWLDNASLLLLERILSSKVGNHLCLLLAYSDGKEQSKDDVLRLAASVDAKYTTVTYMSCPGLTQGAAQDFLADSLHATPGEVMDLASVMLRKTSGNPMLFRQLLNRLDEDGLLWFDFTAGGWRWSLDRVKAVPSPIGVADLLVPTLQGLRPLHRELLVLAACLGTTFSVPTLEQMAAESALQIEQAINHSIDLGILVPVDGPSLDANRSYQFGDEHVRRALIETASSLQQQHAHWQIAQYLMRQSTMDNDATFRCVDHLRRVVDILPPQVLLADLVDLAERATDLASTAGAFESAVHFAEYAHRLIGLCDGAEHRSRHLAILKRCAQLTSLNGDYARSEAFIEQGLALSIAPIDKSFFYIVRLRHEETQGHYERAIETGRIALALLGVVLPSDSEIGQALNEELAITRKYLPQWTLAQVDSVIKVRGSDDFEQDLMELITGLWTPCFLSGNKTMLVWLSLKAFNLANEQGLSDHAIMALANFAYVYAPLTGDYRVSHEIGAIALRLADQCSNLLVKSRALFIAAIGPNNWGASLNKSIEWVQEAYQAGRQCGDVIYSCYAALFIMTDSFMQGRSLKRIAQFAEANLDYLRTQSPSMYEFGRSFYDIVKALMRKDGKFERQMLHLSRQQESYIGYRASMNFRLLLAAFWLEDDDVLPMALEALETSRDNQRGMFKYPETCFLTAITLLRAINSGMTVGRQREEHLAIVEDIRIQFKAWSEDCGRNFSARYHLVEAEYFRYRADTQSVSLHYEKAIGAAKEEGAWALQALACRLYGEYGFDNHYLHASGSMLAAAVEAYQQWGALSVVQRLRQRYAEVLPGLAAPPQDTAPASLEGNGPDATLDWMSALKAALTISQQIQSDRLPSTLLKIIAENTGADRAGLIQTESSGKWRLGAVYSYVENDTLLGCIGGEIDSQMEEHLPLLVINYVVNTSKEVILNNVKYNLQFARDRYLQKRAPRSLVCIPLVERNHFIGIIYLENGSIAENFSSVRLDFIRMISAQAASALNGARLYSELKESENRFRDLIEGSIQGILIFSDKQALFVNKTLVTMLGYDSADELLHLPDISSIIGKEYRKAFAGLAEAASGGLELPTLMEVDALCRNGRVVSLQSVNRHILWMGAPAVQCTLVDITLRKQKEREVQTLSLYDPLTNLPNRSLFMHNLTQAISDRDSIGAVLLIDIDNFKEVNDTIGHDAGDELLIGVAKRLHSELKGSDTAARIGSDEFAVVLRHLRHRDNAERIAEHLVNQLGRPYLIDGQEVFCSCSIGITSFPDDSIKPQELIRYADLAMYSAKTDGGGTYAFYRPELNTNLQRRKQLSLDLRRAVESGSDFRLVYQPLVDAQTGKTASFEALLRWLPPAGFVSPAEFIPIAEATGLIVPLGRWVLYEACRQTAVWLRQGHQDIYVAVNISAAQLYAKDFHATVEQVLHDSQLPPDRLELEITESMMMENVNQVIDTLNKLSAMGVRLALDDFGTGYSSLSYLQRLPFDKLKIDRSFVNDLENSRGGAAVAKTIIALGENLNMKVVAEGVETEQQLDFLRDSGCHLIQGYYFSKPMTPEDATQWLEAKR